MALVSEPDYLRQILAPDQDPVFAYVDRHMQAGADDVSFVAGDGWHAVPVETGTHFAPEDISRILEASPERRFTLPTQ
jgi:hypothetical protein